MNDNHGADYLARAVGGLTQREADVLLCIELACRSVLHAPAGTTYGVARFCEMYRFAAVHARRELVRRVSRLCANNQWGITAGTHRAAVLTMARDYAAYLVEWGTSVQDAGLYAVGLTTDIRGADYDPDTDDPVLRLYGERAGRSAETVMYALTTDDTSWLCDQRALNRPSILPERMFSVLYAATAEYLANQCRESAAGKDVHVDLWLAEHADTQWQFAPRAGDGAWFVSVDDALYSGVEAATDGTAPFGLFTNHAWESAWFVGDGFGNTTYTDDALAHAGAVDTLVLRAREMMAGLAKDGVWVGGVY